MIRRTGPVPTPTERAEQYRLEALERVAEQQRIEMERCSNITGVDEHMRIRGMRASERLMRTTTELTPGRPEKIHRHRGEFTDPDGKVWPSRNLYQRHLSHLRRTATEQETTMTTDTITEQETTTMTTDTIRQPDHWTSHKHRRKTHQKEARDLFNRYRADRKTMGARHDEEARIHKEAVPPAIYELNKGQPFTVAGTTYPTKKAAMIALGLWKERPKKRKADKAGRTNAEGTLAVPLSVDPTA